MSKILDLQSTEVIDHMPTRNAAPRFTLDKTATKSVMNWFAQASAW